MNVVKGIECEDRSGGSLLPYNRAVNSSGVSFACDKMDFSVFGAMIVPA
jgi:hypothetical protein